MVWPGNGIGEEADEIAGMTRLEGDADFAIGLEAGDARAVAGARINDHERPPLGIDLHARRRDDAHQSVVHRPAERPPVEYELNLVVEHVRGGLGHVLAILIAALAHHIPKQEQTLGGVGQVFGRG